MSKRIRYEKSSAPGIFFSVKTYTSNGCEYRVSLNMNTLNFNIINLTKNGVVETLGEAVSGPQLKIKAKQALVKLGVVMDEEKRSKALLYATEIPAD
jgi:hypothetical protein